LSFFQDYLRFTVTLVAVLDPFLAIPIFLSVAAARGPAGRRRLVNAVSVTVFAVLSGAAIFGEALLAALGTSLPAFQVGGGLVLLLMALAMLNAQAGGVRQSKAEAEEIESRDASGVVPLAVPLLAGPGAISTTIVAAQAGDAVNIASLVVCIALVCMLLWSILRVAEPIGSRLGTTGLNIATRLLGLLLAAIAIEMMAGGLKTLLPGLA
jgi:multiple antibiotic resistance protein